VDRIKKKETRKIRNLINQHHLKRRRVRVFEYKDETKRRIGY